LADASAIGFAPVGAVRPRKKAVQMMKFMAHARTAALLAVLHLTACGAADDLHPISGPPDAPTGGDAAGGDAPTADVSLVIRGVPTVALVSQALTYEIDVSDAGGLGAHNVVVTQPVVAGTAVQSVRGDGWDCGAADGAVTCRRAALGVGAAPAIAVVVTAPSAVGSMTTTASVASDAADPDLTNNTASVQTQVSGPPDLALALTGSSDPIGVTAELTYAITVTNTGADRITGVTLLDTLPASAAFVRASGDGWSCAAAALQVTCTRPALDAAARSEVSIVVTAPAVSGGTLTNAASVSASITDPTPDDNHASITTKVVESADLSIAQTTTPDPVHVGAQQTYTLAVHNAGPSAAAQVSVVDALPAGATFVSVDGNGWTCSRAGTQLTCTRPALAVGASAPPIAIVVTAPAAQGQLFNEAKVSSAISDPDESNNDEITSSNADPLADFAIAVTGSPDVVRGPAQPGCPGTSCASYTIVVTNHGPEAAGRLVIVEKPNRGTFVDATGDGWQCVRDTTGEIMCGRQPYVVAPGTVMPPLVIRWGAPSDRGGTIDFSAHLFGDIDPDTSNNRATVHTAVAP